MDDRTVTRMWTSAQEPPGDSPEWVLQERRRIRDALLSTHPFPYPCHFGAIGEAAGNNYYTFLDLRRDFAGEAAATARDLAHFIEIQRGSPDERLSLLVMVGPPSGERDFAGYRDLFWKVLSGLHSADRGPRPPDMPDDPDDPKWDFNFGGEPLFSFGMCPAYGPRRSRALGQCLLIAMQSRSVFRNIGGSTAAGRAAKRRIRRSLSRYEDVPLLSDAGDGLGSTAEKWKQYFPEIDGRPLTGGCPIRWERR
ncbi:YqcI/YcgG family protein [Streptosporangium algeriense]|uniref:YqcI/YcgG family protein n=1 Tax=Streptosporangium algeriense TaxID=1682748 RepID=A0ABW3DPJ2_9ACTN